MQTDNEAAIEQLAHSVAEETGLTAAPDPASAPNADPCSDPNNQPGPNSEFCRKVIATALKQHAESVRKTFHAKIEPVAGSSLAERISNRAAMAPELQEQIADDATAVLDKYGLAKFINAEASLIAGLATYYFDYQSAKADLERIINPPEKKA